MWTGARATQRGLALASTKILCGAIEATSVRKFLRDPVSLGIDAKCFESRHREWCNAALEYLFEQGVESVTFGRVAKLFAVYLKVMVVVGESRKASLLLSFIHLLTARCSSAWLRPQRLTLRNGHGGGRWRGRS